MPKKIILKTGATKASVSAFVATISDPEQKRDVKRLLALMRKVTGKTPKMWGSSMIGFGTYEYKRSNGDFGEYFATGFSPRKQALTIYVIPGYESYGDLLKKLGPHTHAKSCLYIKHLEQIDLKVLEQLIRAGFRDLGKTHRVW